MAPSHSGGRTGRNEQMPADGRDSEAQAPRHSTNTAVANYPVPRPPDPDSHTHDSLPQYGPSSVPPYQLIYGVPPTALPHQGHGYGFRNLDPWRAQQTALSGAVQPPQLQTARMYQALWTPPPGFYGAPGRQFFHGSPQVPYGAPGNPYVHGSPQVSRAIQQQVYEGQHLSPQGRQVNANFQANPSQTPELRSHRPPSANMSQSPHGQLHFQPPPAQVSPPVQEWPTWNLSNTLSKKKPERKLRESQERSQQPADAHLTVTLLQQRRDVQPASSSAPSNLGKRKAVASNPQPPLNLPPSLRQPAQTLRTGSGYVPGDGAQYQSQYLRGAISDCHPISQPPLQSPHYNPHIPSYDCAQNKYEQNKLHTSSSSYGQHAGMHGSSHHEHASRPLLSRVSLPPQHRELQSSAEPLPAEPICREDVPQPISPNYEDYKWPVKLYELRPDTKFDFVHAYMEDWFEKNILSSRYKWHCHTSKGFIERGNRFSILVLHNAADPFTWNTPSESTTSFAVYGRFAHTHEELRWTTITPWVPGFIESSADFILKNRWDFDMPKATEKRFHRAYWLAANMVYLGKLLNQRIIDERPHDELEAAELEENIYFTEEDLQCQWIDGPMSAEHAEKVWKKILDKVDCQAMHTLGGEHMVIGCSERAWETERYG